MAQVLIVEDDIRSRDSLAQLLVAAGHKVVASANGHDALKEMMERKPDLIVLDLAMPEMDGPSFLEVLRSYLRLQTLPVVILTALSQSPLIDRARNHKVNSVLLKGNVTGDDILKALDEALAANPA